MRCGDLLPSADDAGDPRGHCSRWWSRCSLCSNSFSPVFTFFHLRMSSGKSGAQLEERASSLTTLETGRYENIRQWSISTESAVFALSLKQSWLWTKTTIYPFMGHSGTCPIKWISQGCSKEEPVFFLKHGLTFMSGTNMSQGWPKTFGFKEKRSWGGSWQTKGKGCLNSAKESIMRLTLILFV